MVDTVDRQLDLRLKGPFAARFIFSVIWWSLADTLIDQN